MRPESTVGSRCNEQVVGVALSCLIKRFVEGEEYLGGLRVEAQALKTQKLWWSLCRCQRLSGDLRNCGHNPRKLVGQALGDRARAQQSPGGRIQRDP